MPTNDFFFKKIFGSAGSEKITTSLLEAILKIDITAIDLDKNPITEKDVLDDKLGVMDIRLEINGNIDCDVEMEMINRGNIEIRLMRYVSKIFIKGLKVGEKYVEETASVRQMGYEEGLETGQEKEKKKTAKIMKDKKYSIDEIMQITELSKEEIEKL